MTSRVVRATFTVARPVATELLHGLRVVDHPDPYPVPGSKVVKVEILGGEREAMALAV